MALTTLDIILLAPLLFGAWTGFKKGLLLEIVALASFILAIIGGIYLLDWAVDFIGEYIEGVDHLLPMIAFIIVFIGIVLLVNLIGQIVKKALDLTPLGIIDKLAGLILGVLKLGFFVSLLIWGASSLGFGLSAEFTEESILFPWIEPLAPNTVEFLMSIFPYGESVLEELSRYFQSE